MDRLLSGRGGTVTTYGYDANGDLADIDTTNAPTVVVRDSAGVTALTPTGTKTGTGSYAATIPATLVALDSYSVVWTWPNAVTQTTTFEIVGSFLYSIAQFQSFDAVLSNETAYPPARIRDIREIVEERFERACNVSFTRRARRQLLDGSGTDTLWLDERLVTRVVGVSVGGGTASASGYTAYPDGKLVTTGSFAVGSRNVSVLYEHGYDPTPGPIVDAALRYGRDLIVKGAFDDMSRATGVQSELGFYRITQAGKERPTGIPDVDAVLASYDHRVPMVG